MKVSGFYKVGSPVTLEGYHADIYLIVPATKNDINLRCCII